MSLTSGLEKFGHESSKVLTTLRVPTRTLGGVWLSETIMEMKFAVMPMMAIKESDCRIRTLFKVAPRAP